MGMAGDMFSSALIAMGVPEKKMVSAMLHAAGHIGHASIKTLRVPYLSEEAVKLDMHLDVHADHLLIDDAQKHLIKILEDLEIISPYSDFALRSLAILADAEREAHSTQWLNEEMLGFEVIGIARTPYSQKEGAPYQPFAVRDDEGENFYIEIYKQFVPGITGMDSFSHLDVLSYLHQSEGYSLTVTPPWKNDPDGGKQVGLFASRSPNRPSPLGLTIAQIKNIRGHRIYTGPLDLYDGTPVVDIKPHIGSMEAKEIRVGNDGWLEGSDHLSFHKQGIPHRHSSEKTVLHEAQDILIDIAGATFGMQYIGVSPGNVMCDVPVAVGGGEIHFSHGVLPVPAPAVTSVLKNFKIPHVSGPVDSELLTPTGAALLAAMEPVFYNRMPLASIEDFWNELKHGFGMGTKKFDFPNVLRLTLMEQSY